MIEFLLGLHIGLSSLVYLVSSPIEAIEQAIRISSTFFNEKYYLAIRNSS